MITLPNRFRPAPVLCAILAAGLFGQQFAHAGPSGGNVVAGSATIVTQGSATTIAQSSDRAIINWRDFSTASNESVRLVQPGRTSATLNRVTGTQASALMGQLQANGQVILINPNGVLIGRDARVDVGSLIATTSALADDDFLSGRLRFTPSGVPGAGIRNEGTITAAEGGLVALVAPNVRNDGVIEARLGKVQIGAADRFTIDLYGDGLINLSLGEEHRGVLRDFDGRPVDALIAMNGSIRTDGGSAVLIAAADASRVLDRSINLQGIVRADTVAEQGGKIVLSGGTGSVEVGGSLAAFGERGGAIDVTGRHVRLSDGASLDAHGDLAGGKVRVGGDWQGSGDLQRSETTEVAAGARIDVRATALGDAGQAVVWSDGHTTFAGTIDARGGDIGGNGGQVEVSGKRILDFAGDVELAAANGRGGSLLLDPEIANLGATEVLLINRLLRVGVTATVAATLDINVNALIDGRGRAAGGSLTLNAGRDINVNEFIVTNNGAVNLNAGTGTLNFAAGKAIFAGSGAINVTTGGNLSLGNLYTTGSLSARSSGGTLTVAQGIDGQTGPVLLRAANDLLVNQPIVNILNGSSLGLISDSGNIVVNAQIDGREANGVSSGPISLVAGNNILLNQSIVAENGPISLTATTGTVTPGGGMGLFSGNGSISVTTGGALSTGVYGTTGALNLRSTGGLLTVATALDETIGNVSLRGGTGVSIDAGIANLRNGSSLTVVSDAGNINVNARIDAQDDTNPSSVVTPVAGGQINMTAANNIAINETMVTFNGAVALTATAGTVTFSNAGTNGSGNKKILAGNAPISITTGGNFSTGTAPPAGLVFSMGNFSGSPGPGDVNPFIAESLKPWVTMATTGKLTLVSTSGNVTIDAPIPQTTGEIEIRAGNSVVVNEKLVNAGAPISITAGTACSVGTCNPTTQGRIVVNNSPSVGVTYVDGGTQNAIVWDGTEVDSRQADLALTAFGDINTGSFGGVASNATMTITSTNGTLLGSIGDSRYPTGFGRPQNVVLSGGAGIGTLGSPFGVGVADAVSAASANGAVYLFVNGTSNLGVTAPSAAGDIFIYSSYGGFGSTSNLSAGRDINLRSASHVGHLTMAAGRDIRMKTLTASSVTVTAAGQDVLFDATVAEMGPGCTHCGSIWMSGDLSVTGVGRDIKFLQDSGVSLMDGSGNPTLFPQPALTLSAGRDVELRRLQTYGAVSITAGDHITLLSDIGPHFIPDAFQPRFILDQGVASLSLATGLAAGDSITMQGARAVGAISITTHTLTSAKSITSDFGPGAVSIATVAPPAITAGAIGTIQEMGVIPIVAAPIFPGPAVNAPAAPSALNALAPLAPSGVGVPLASAPAGADFGELIVVDPEKGMPAGFGEIVPGDGAGPGRISENEIAIALDGPLQSADFGRSGPFSGRNVPEATGRQCTRKADGSCV